MCISEILTNNRKPYKQKFEFHEEINTKDK